MAPGCSVSLAIIAPLLLSVFCARWFISDGQRLAGIIGGLAVIFILWLAAEALVYGACLSCRGIDPSGILCCEWTGAGIVYYTTIALFDAAVCLLISLGLTWYYRGRHKSAAKSE